MKNRFAFNGATTGPADLRTDIRAAGAAGYAALELRDHKIRRYLDGGGTLPELGRMLADAGLRAASINALEGSTLVSGPARDDVLARCRQYCEWAAALGAPTVVAVPSPAAGAGTGEVDAPTVRMLEAMAQVAAAYGVRIGFEFLGFADCSVRTLAHARALVTAVAAPAVGLVIDAFHFYVGGSTPQMLQAVEPDRLCIVHLDDAEARPPGELTDEHRLLPGDGALPLRSFVRTLEAAGYRGLYSVELFRPEYYRWDPVDLARRAREKMEALFRDAA